MKKQAFTRMVLLVLAVFLTLEQAHAGAVVGWYVQGQQKGNGDKLVYNFGDSLMLTCIGQPNEQGNWLSFYVNKGNSAPVQSNLGQDRSLNSGERIFDDFNFVYPGHENFVFIQPQQFSARRSGIFKLAVNVQALRLQDTGVYYCSVAETLITDESTLVDFATSGGITITVNTKRGQNRSTKRYQASNFLKYSAIILSAGKFLNL